MLERAALAILVNVGALSWFTVGVSGFCWLARALCRPCWSKVEERLDFIVRLTVFLTCVAAALVEFKAVYEGKIWLAVVLNTVGGVAAGPDRLHRAFEANSGCRQVVRGEEEGQYRERRGRADREDESIEKMSEEGDLFCILFS